MIYLKLFLSFLQVGLLSVGGGYAAIAFIREQTVEINNWLTMADFSNLTAIAEMTPGPIAINAATFVGIKIAGFGGAFSATLGCITPSILISSLLAFVYYKFKSGDLLKSILASIRPVTIGIILSAGISLLCNALWENKNIGFSSLDFISLFIFVISFIVLRKTKLSPVLIIFLSGIIYLSVSLILPLVIK